MSTLPTIAAQRILKFFSSNKGKCCSIRYLTISSTEILEREKKVCANNYDVLPVVMERGEGVYMWDVEGKRYLDFIAAFATLNQGHCHPRIVKALQEQAALLHHTSRAMSHNKIYEFLEFLTNLLGYDKALLTNTGVEGGETAVKLARKWAYEVKKVPENKAEVVFAEENFWGRTLAAVSISNSSITKNHFGPYLPGFSAVPYNDLDKLEEKLRNPNVCAFMVEPIQGEAGAVVPNDGYLSAVRRLCSQYNVLWIADEVQTGLGRTGKLLAVDHENVKPDILILGKALSGGLYPVSATLANSAIMDIFTPGTHGSTYGGNPLGCRVALEALKVILDEKLTENAAKMGQLFRSELSERLHSDKVETIRGKGLLNGVVLKPGYSAKSIGLLLKESGLITKYMAENVLRFTPPLVINEQQMRDGLDIIVHVVNNASPKTN